jgi:signal transduction histidine kinase
LKEKATLISLFATNKMDNEALETFRETNELQTHFILLVPEMTLAYEGLASIFERKKEYLIATTYLERGLALAQQTNNTTKKIRFNTLLSAICLSQKNNESIEKAFFYLKNGFNLNKILKNDTLDATLELYQAQYFLFKKRYPEAKQSAKKAMLFFKKNKQLTLEINAYHTLYELYLKEKNSDTALHYLSLYTATNDSLMQHKEEAYSLIRALYEGRKKDKRLLVNNSILLQQSKTLEQKTWIIFFFLSIFCLGLGFFIYYRKQAKRKIATQKHEIEAMIGELKAFNYSVSHDLKVPLLEMSNAIRLLERYERENSNAALQIQVQKLDKTVRNTRKMIDEMLAYSILDNQDFTPVRFDSRELIEDVLYSFASTIEAKKIKIRLAPNLPKVYGDVAMLRQVFQNLISNAIKFSQQNPHPLIEIEWKKQAQQTVLSVRDNGIGFDAAQNAQLFQLFKRLHSSEKYEGIGAGLAIVKRIVTRHQGEVWAEGSPNQGAIFYISLPKLS